LLGNFLENFPVLLKTSLKIHFPKFSQTIFRKNISKVRKCFQKVFKTFYENFLKIFQKLNA